jgi:hypothetical protein
MVETLDSIREVVAATRGGALTFKTADVGFSSVITGAEVVQHDLPYRRMSAFLRSSRQVCAVALTYSFLQLQISMNVTTVATTYTAIFSEEEESVLRLCSHFGSASL